MDKQHPQWLLIESVVDLSFRIAHEALDQAREQALVDIAEAVEDLYDNSSEHES